MKFIIIFSLLIVSGISTENLKYTFETKYIEMPLDHFTYYGTSLPFGNLSFTDLKYLGYLSSSQALADYVYLINDLQKTYSKDVKRLPVVAFGGSYGGMLSAWLRMKYPNSIVGAIASSAPIWQFKDMTPCGNFDRIVTNVFEALGRGKCSLTIKNSWAVIRSETKNDTGKAFLSKLWNLCSPLKSQDDVDDLIEWLSNIYINLAMVNYPYPTSFLVPLPANPVREFCSEINSVKYKDNAGLLNAIGKDDLGEAGWNFQACTEIVMPMCSTDFDMFENEAWDFKKFSDACFKTEGVRPRSEDVPILEYGGKDLRYASNIVFSNGLLDPWSSGGVLSNISDSISAVIIPDGAHHFDLRANNKNDSESVRNARKFHIHQIGKWLDQYYGKTNKPKRREYNLLSALQYFNIMY
ncbi:hypothetical protein NQ317_009762 [Molorchus minor]|uniref:Lysosomal Pro-X carboxypeptidase n=1 Tax=Molorchus minor TaxID=1323400 RepID=A0ABQ9K3W1_9CUCU|nr:hypothetical protein NQ317_009762 [Molorchus minor]